jgi:hypothetical protein
MKNKTPLPIRPFNAATADRFPRAICKCVSCKALFSIGPNEDVGFHPCCPDDGMPLVAEGGVTSQEALDSYRSKG